MLRISFFGGVSIAHSDRDAPVRLTRTTQSLLAYLVLERQHLHAREVLADLFWADQPGDKARNCLNTALWRLRSALEPDGVRRSTYLLTTSLGDVGFNQDSSHWIDAAEIELKAREVLSHPVEELQPHEVQALELELPLCRGQLLEGLYHDWALRERERLHQIYLRSLGQLMLYYRHRGDLDRSIEYGQCILRHDPLREEIHREVMRLYVANGQRTLALRQYESCRQTLATELGIAPMEETQALHANIAPEMIASSGHTPTSRNGKSPPVTLDQAISQLHAALQRLDEAQSQLRKATELVARVAAAA